MSQLLDKTILMQTQVYILNKLADCIDKHKKYSPYTELEYIQSSGTQWINTGINENNCYMLEFEFMVVSVKADWQSLLAGTIDNFTLGTSYGNLNGSYLRYRSGEKFNTNNLIINEKNKFIIKDNTCKMNDISYSGINTSNSVGTGGRNIFICNNGNVNRPSIIRVYSLKLYGNNGNLLRDFIPRKDLYNVPCLYDKVSEQFFYNAGTGSFIAGPEKEV